MNKLKIFSVLDIVVAGLLTLAGVLWVKDAMTLGNPKQVMSGLLGIYLILFAILITVMGLFHIPSLRRHLSLGYTYGGKAIAYIFLGGLTFRDNSWQSIIIGGTVIGIGVIAFIFLISTRQRPVPLFCFSDTLPSVNASSTITATSTTRPSTAPTFESSYERNSHATGPAPTFKPQNHPTQTSPGTTNSQNPWGNNSANDNPFRNHNNQNSTYPYPV